jgi:hypothetical protein
MHHIVCTKRVSIYQLARCVYDLQLDIQHGITVCQVVVKNGQNLSMIVRGQHALASAACKRTGSLYGTQEGSKHHAVPVLKPGPNPIAAGLGDISFDQGTSVQMNRTHH